MISAGRPLGLALLAALASAGCGQSLPAGGRQLLLRAYDASREGNYPQVISLADRFLQDYGRGPRDDEALYLRGLAHAQMLQAPQAQADLAAAMDRSGRAELKAKAAAALGELATSAGDAASAQQWYCKSLALEDRRSPADQAYFQLGLILQRQGQWQQADIQFSRLVFFFEGELARQARRRMQSRAWTVQAGCLDSRARAQGLADRLNQANPAASVAPVLEQGKLAFSVQVGRYNTYEQAQAQLPAVARLVEGAQVVVTR